MDYLLRNGGLDLNHLALQNFPQEDSEQFAMLIGYSVSGFCDLSYASDDTKDAAEKMSADSTLSTAEARAEALQLKLDAIRLKLGPLVTEVFNVHPDDLV